MQMSGTVLHRCAAVVGAAGRGTHRPHHQLQVRQQRRQQPAGVVSPLPRLAGGQMPPRDDRGGTAGGHHPPDWRMLVWDG